MSTGQVFLLSPAYCGGRRAALLVRPGGSFDLAVRLQTGTADLGEVFSFMSGLYFRGKLAYAERFGSRPDGGEATLVITPTRGLRHPSAPTAIEELREFASVNVDAGDARYVSPLERDLRALDAALAPETRIVLLGSIATPKYVDALARVVGSRLHYPPSFVGRGDMSRGGLLLRAARSGVELGYAPLDPAAPRRGPRPPRLDRPRPAGTSGF
jgi:hypothetical protein